MRSTLARVASNEAVFAAANDSIADVAARLGEEMPLVPFLCECPDPACTELAELSLGEYAALRLFADRFLVSRSCLGGDIAGSVLLALNDRYAVVDRPQPA
ncbi:MAG: hypothetical protein ACXVZL_03790 [Gaiellaceae bacterium]